MQGGGWRGGAKWRGWPISSHAENPNSKKTRMTTRNDTLNLTLSTQHDSSGSTSIPHSWNFISCDSTFNMQPAMFQCHIHVYIHAALDGRTAEADTGWQSPLLRQKKLNYKEYHISRDTAGGICQEYIGTWNSMLDEWWHRQCSCSKTIPCTSAYIYGFPEGHYSSTKRQCTYTFRKLIACICMFVIFIRYILRRKIHIIILLKLLSCNNSSIEAIFTLLTMPTS